MSCRTSESNSPPCFFYISDVTFDTWKGVYNVTGAARYQFKNVVLFILFFKGFFFFLKLVHVLTFCSYCMQHNCDSCAYVQMSLLVVVLGVSLHVPVSDIICSRKRKKERTLKSLYRCHWVRIFLCFFFGGCQNASNVSGGERRLTIGSHDQGFFGPVCL